jgi:hypothetical protein
MQKEEKKMQHSGIVLSVFLSCESLLAQAKAE